MRAVQGGVRRAVFEWRRRTQPRHDQVVAEGRGRRELGRGRVVAALGAWGVWLCLEGSLRRHCWGQNVSKRHINKADAHQISVIPIGNKNTILEPIVVFFVQLSSIMFSFVVIHIGGSLDPLDPRSPRSPHACRCRFLSFANNKRRERTDDHGQT